MRSWALGNSGKCGGVVDHALMARSHADCPPGSRYSGGGVAACFEGYDQESIHLIVVKYLVRVL